MTENLLEALLSPEHILLDVNVSGKKALFEASAEVIHQQNGVDEDAVFECLFARERLGSTALGQSVAIPHGRLAHLESPLAVFFRLQEPIAFDAPDGKPVQLVFTLLVPSEACAQHLEILSRLAELFSNKQVREALMAAPDHETVRQIFLQSN